MFLCSTSKVRTRWLVSEFRPGFQVGVRLGFRSGVSGMLGSGCTAQGSGLGWGLYLISSPAKSKTLVMVTLLGSGAFGSFCSAAAGGTDAFS